MKTFGRLLQLALPLKSGMALATLVGVLTVGAGIGLMTTSAYLISMAALHPSVAALGVAIVGVRFFGLARAIFRYLERYTSHNVTFRLLTGLRSWFYRGIEPLAPARLLEYRSGDLLSRVVSDIELLQNFYLRVIAPPLVAALVGLGMWFLLGAYNLIFAVSFLAFYLLAGLVIPLLAHLLSRRAAHEVVTVRAELNSQLIDSIQGMADLVAFGQEEQYQARIEGLNHKLSSLQKRLALIEGLQSAGGNLLMNLATWTMLVLAVPMVRDGKLDGIYLALLALAALSSFEAVLPLPLAFQQLGSSLEAAQRLFEIVDTTPAVPNSVVRKESLLAQDFSLEVEALSFRYGPAEPLALDNLSFSLKPGQTLALVGPSGAGKSTLGYLLLRFWDYHNGRITLGGTDLRAYTPAEVQQYIGVVSQNTHLFNATIKDNLLIARPEATQQELEEACKIARIHEFIESLPLGYRTRLGEMGYGLSGGERQRLAIARAVLKNAPILLLDEATANLDATNERETLQALQSLMKDRTTVIITHRLVGLEKASEILVLNEGRIVERGTQAQLLQQEGLYWRMWELQREVEAYA